MENIFFDREKKKKAAAANFPNRDTWLVCTLRSPGSDLANNY